MEEDPLHKDCSFVLEMRIEGHKNTDLGAKREEKCFLGETHCVK